MTELATIILPSVENKTNKVRLQKAMSSVSYVGNPYGNQVYSGGDLSFGGGYYYDDHNVPGTEIFSGHRAGAVPGQGSPRGYREEVDQSRFFYKYDPFASIVINRMVDMATSTIRNRRKDCNDEEMKYFNAIAERISPIISSMILEYLVNGMTVPDYGIKKEMGTTINKNLGRKRYSVPDSVWLRNPDHIILKKKPATNDRLVYLRIPQEDISFILSEGRQVDGTQDKELYNSIVREFPDYVEQIRQGKREVRLENTMAIMRKLQTHADYPQPFLVPSLASLKHKWRIKQMDYSLASRAIEAVRLINVGDKDFPAEEGDEALESVRQQISNRPNSYNGEQEPVYSLVVNHTVAMKWVYPPLEALLSDAKYSEPNADILLGMGFSRVLLVGESLRSNSGGDVSVLGPIATLQEVRANILVWIRAMYRRMAELNNFTTIPEPFFPAIRNADIYRFLEWGLAAVKMGSMSTDTLLQMFGSDFEAERIQKDAENAISTPRPIPDAAPIKVDLEGNMIPEGTGDGQTSNSRNDTGSDQSRSRSTDSEIQD